MRDLSRRDFLRLTGAAGAAGVSGLLGGPVARLLAQEGEAYRTVPVENGGTLRGVVRFDGEPPQLPGLEADTRYPCCQPHRKPNPSLILDEQRGVRCAVLQLAGVKAGKAPETGPTVLADEHCMFEPHVVVQTLGGALRYVNRDDIPHHFWLVEDELGTVSQEWVSPEVQQVDVAEESLPPLARAYAVKSNTHWWEFGWLVVHDSPYFAVTAADGSYAIDGIPPGRYRLTVWHEPIVQPIQATNQKRQLYRVLDQDHADGVEVEVPAGGAATADFTLRLGEL